jgi:hypothetical protein
MVLSHALDRVMLIRHQLDKIRIVKRVKHGNPKICGVIQLLDVISWVRSMNNVFWVVCREKELIHGRKTQGRMEQHMHAEEMGIGSFLALAMQRDDTSHATE